MVIVMFGEACLPGFTSIASFATVKWYWVAIRGSSSAIKFPYATKSLPLGKAPFVFCLRGKIGDDLFSEQTDRRQHLALLTDNMTKEEVITAQRPILLNLRDDFLGATNDQ